MSRLLVSALVVVVAVLPSCKSEGERRLIGSWEVRWDQPGDTSEPADQPGTEQPGMLDRLGQALERAAIHLRPDMAVTFNDDGTYSEAVGHGARRNVRTGRWVLVSPGDDEITLRLEPTAGAAEARVQEVTIRFQGDDEMLYPSARGAPLRYVRRGTAASKAPPAP